MLNNRLKPDHSVAIHVPAGMPDDPSERPASLARITPRLSTRKIYILEKKLERTPTHKIKMIQELARLDLTKFL